MAIPSTVQPGRLQERIQIEPERSAISEDPLLSFPDESGTDRSIAPGMTFRLEEITLEGNETLTIDAIKDIYADRLGTQVGLADLYDITQRITTRYRSKGYILSRAVLPPQRIADGRVSIRIVEGFVDTVTFAGTDTVSDLLTAYGRTIRDTRPIDLKTLERYLLLMEDLPGLSVRAVIRPATTATGGADIIVYVTEKRLEGDLSIDNRGTRYIGPLEASATGTINNVLGVHDRTRLRLFTAQDINELRYGQFTHEEPVGNEGSKLTLSASRTRSSPGFRLRSLQIIGQDTTLSAELSHPFLRSRAANFTGTLKGELRNTDTNALSAALFRDRIRTMRMGSSYDFMDQWSAANRLEVEVSQGLGWGNNADAVMRSRAAAHGSFLKVTAQASRQQPLSGPISFYIAVQGQKAADALLPAEQFAIGGPAFGSAYDPSELLGDSGIAARTEVQYSRSTEFRYLQGYQAYGFYDIGRVWARSAPPGTASHSSLASTGLGVRFNAIAQLSGSVELALPLTRKVATFGEDGGAPRLFFSLSRSF